MRQKGYCNKSKSDLQHKKGYIQIEKYKQFKAQMHNNHSTQLVNCSMDEPLQVLMDRLSSKSSELYIFWQNYNQLYSLYQQKTNEIVRLRQQIMTLRRENMQHPKAQVVEDSFLKERYLNLEKNFDDLKLESQRLKNQCRDLRKQTSKFHDENLQLQTLLQQLREQNNIQRQSIQKILNQLKAAQTQLSSYSKLYDQIQQKEYQVAKLVQNEKRLNQIIMEREEEIEELLESEREMKIQYEALIRDSMQNAKNKVIESLPNLIKTSKQKVQVVAN